MDEVNYETRAKALEAENAALRTALTMMHRRAQRNEGAAARLDRVRSGYERDLRTMVSNVTYWRNEGQRLRRDIRELTTRLSKIPSWIASWFS